MESIAEVRHNSNRRIHHGFSKTLLYQVWGTMKDRCYNKNIRAYKNYGARGVRVCDEWETSFETFREWAISHGYTEGMEIDRKNNDGHYCPDNCRWVAHKDNCRNKRNNVLFTAYGETKTIIEWSEDKRCTVDSRCLRFRVKSGTLSPEEMVSMPAPPHKPHVRLSNEQIREIQGRVIIGTMGGDRRSPNGTNNRGNAKELAIEFGVSPNTIVKIRKRKG